MSRSCSRSEAAGSIPAGSTSFLPQIYGVDFRTFRPALSISVRNVTQIITLRREDVAQVRNALGRYQQALAELNRKALSGITLLRRLRRSAGRARGR